MPNHIFVATLQMCSNERGDHELVEVQEFVPRQYHCLFPFSHFNSMQSAIVASVLQSDSNMVVASPTGSGKTIIHELAIVRVLMHSTVTDVLPDFKCVFIAPNKALCQQRATEWKRKFGQLGLL